MVRKILTRSAPVASARHGISHFGPVAMPGRSRGGAALVVGVTSEHIGHPAARCDPACRAGVARSSGRAGRTFAPVSEWAPEPEPVGPMAVPGTTVTAWPIEMSCCPI